MLQTCVRYSVHFWWWNDNSPKRWQFVELQQDNLNRYLAQKFASYINSPPVFVVMYSDETSSLDKALI